GCPDRRLVQQIVEGRPVQNGSLRRPFGGRDVQRFSAVELGEKTFWGDRVKKIVQGAHWRNAKAALFSCRYNLMALAPSLASVAAAREALAAADPALAKAHASTPVFEWRLRPGGYEGLFRMIVEQQVSVAAAASIWKRVIDGLEGQVTPEAVLARDVETLRTFGLSSQKAKYGHEIA